MDGNDGPVVGTDHYQHGRDGHARVEGIDAGRVSAWFVDNIPGVVLPLGFRLVAGGRSNFERRPAPRWSTRWYGQYQASRDEHGGPDIPDVDATHTLLSANIPEQGAAGIVHGDFRLDNAVVDDGANVAGFRHSITWLAASARRRNKALGR